MVTLKKITLAELPYLWEISYKTSSPLWVEYDAPYLHTYEALTWDKFNKEQKPFFLSEQVQGIYHNGLLIGATTYYWESRETRWLEIGLVIFEEKHWGQGFGKSAVWQLVDQLFNKFPEIQRLGYTTWSKNVGMIALGESLKFKQEGRLRKTVYYEETYFDKIKMGILRDEWKRELNENHC